MRSSEARAILEAARGWEAQGMFKTGAFAHIENSLAQKAKETSLAMQTFFVIGGILLGAATAALYALLRVNDAFPDAESAAWGYFFVCALILLGAGVGTHVARQKDLGDALLIAGIVPLAILLGPETPGNQDILWAVPFLGALGLVAFRRQAYLLPLVGTALACVALPVFLYRLLATTELDGPTLMWLGGAFGLWAGMALWNHFQDLNWRRESAAMTTLGLAGAWIATTIVVIEPDFNGGYEILIAAVLAGLIGAGVALHQRGIIFAAAAALTVDVIVFAFNFGATSGLLTLVGLAAAMITAAIVLRSRRSAD